MNFFRACLFRTGLISGFLFLGACGGGFGEDYEVIDLSDHFWSHVDGSYHSSENGYYIDFNSSDRTASWHQPLKVGNKEKGEVCYLSVEAEIKSISTLEPGFIFDSANNPETLRAKGVIKSWSLNYVTTPTSAEQSECEDIKRSNSYVEIEPLFVPIRGYGHGVIELDRPMACIFLGCEPVKSASSQDFSEGSPGVYRQGSLPWENK